MVLRNEQGAEWTLLGTFGGAELAFVRELFADENVPYREEPQRPQLGIARSVLWVAASEHARAVALLAEAQAEAVEAVQRETAALSADEAQAAHLAARREGKEARRHDHERAQADPSEAHPSEPDPAADRAVRFIAGGLLAFMLVIALITWIGERYGTHRPTPGRDGKVCFGPRQTNCR